MEPQADALRHGAYICLSATAATRPALAGAAVPSLAAGLALRWLSRRAGDVTYDLTPAGIAGFAALGVDVEAARALRRRLAFACIDWSERTPHLGGALGAALLHLALKRAWVSRDLDSRTLTLTSRGRRDLRVEVGLDLPP